MSENSENSLMWKENKLAILKKLNQNKKAF